MAKQLAFHFDASACIGCKACQIACNDRSNLQVGLIWRRVFSYEGGGWVQSPENKNLYTPSNMFAYSMSIACMHCEKPPCADVCPTGAITKRSDGVVLIDQRKCIGCRYCEWSCPYGALHFDSNKSVMSKCDFCQDRLAENKNPVCVDACMTRVLKFGDLDELRTTHGSLSAIEPLPDPNITKPSLVISPHKNAVASGKGTGKIVELEEL